MSAYANIPSIFIDAVQNAAWLEFWTKLHQIFRSYRRHHHHHHRRRHQSQYRHRRYHKVFYQQASDNDDKVFIMIYNYDCYYFKNYQWKQSQERCFYLVEFAALLCINKIWGQRPGERTQIHSRRNYATPTILYNPSTTFAFCLNNFHFLSFSRKFTFKRPLFLFRHASFFCSLRSGLQWQFAFRVAVDFFLLDVFWLLLRFFVHFYNSSSQ